MWTRAAPVLALLVAVGPAGAVVTSHPSPAVVRAAVAPGLDPVAARASPVVPGDVSPQSARIFQTADTIAELDGAPLVAPLTSYRVSSHFGLRRLAWEAAPRQHRGVDLAARSGAAVRAIGAGEVVSAGWRGGHGLSVQIRHANGLISSYSHLRSLSVEALKGARLAAGHQLGEVGSTGSSTGPHLHFEMRDETGRALDPRPFLRGVGAPDLTQPYRPRSSDARPPASTRPGPRVILTQGASKPVRANTVTVRQPRRRNPPVQLSGGADRRRAPEVIAFGPPNTVTVRGN